MTLGERLIATIALGFLAPHAGAAQSDAPCGQHFFTTDEITGEYTYEISPGLLTSIDDPEYSKLHRFYEGGNAIIVREGNHFILTWNTMTVSLQLNDTSSANWDFPIREELPSYNDIARVAGCPDISSLTRFTGEGVVRGSGDAKMEAELYLAVTNIGNSGIASMVGHMILYMYDTGMDVENARLDFPIYLEAIPTP